MGKRNPIQQHLGRTIRRQVMGDKRRVLKEKAEKRDSEIRPSDQE